jgi:hypothetical protein
VDVLEQTIATAPWRILEKSLRHSSRLTDELVAVPRAGAQTPVARVPRIFQESVNASDGRFITHPSRIGLKEDAMLRVPDFTHFGTLNRVAEPEPPSAALAGAAWTQLTADPYFVEIDPAEMGYRTAPRGFASRKVRGDRRERGTAFSTFSMAAVGRALHRLGASRQHFAGA